MNKKSILSVAVAVSLFAANAFAVQFSMKELPTTLGVSFQVECNGCDEDRFTLENSPVRTTSYFEFKNEKGEVVAKATQTILSRFVKITLKNADGIQVGMLKQYRANSGKRVFALFDRTGTEIATMEKGEFQDASGTTVAKTVGILKSDGCEWTGFAENKEMAQLLIALGAFKTRNDYTAGQIVLLGGGAVLTGTALGVADYAPGIVDAATNAAYSAGNYAADAAYAAKDAAMPHVNYAAEVATNAAYSAGNYAADAAYAAKDAAMPHVNYAAEVATNAAYSAGNYTADAAVAAKDAATPYIGLVVNTVTNAASTVGAYFAPTTVAVGSLALPTCSIYGECPLNGTVVESVSPVPTSAPQAILPIIVSDAPLAPSTNAILPMIDSMINLKSDAASTVQEGASGMVSKYGPAPLKSGRGKGRGLN